MPYHVRLAKIMGIGALIGGLVGVGLTIIEVILKGQTNAGLGFLMFSMTFLLIGSVGLYIAYYLVPKEKREIEEGVIVSRYDLTAIKNRSREALETAHHRRNYTYKVEYSQDEIIGKCAVCKLSLYASEEILTCPICLATAHNTHLLEWIKIKGYCPKCNSTLKDTDFMENFIEI
jgi:hypothetical protein